MSAPVSEKDGQFSVGLKTLTLVLLLLVAPGCATTKLGGTSASGSAPAIQQATFSVGDRAYQFDSCTSGDFEYFLGVDLFDREGGALVRVVIDPIDGPRVRLRLRGDRDEAGSVLQRDQCRELAADVKYTGWTVNTVRDFSGFVDAECRTEQGQDISLHVHFSHCH